MQQYDYILTHLFTNLGYYLSIQTFAGTNSPYLHLEVSFFFYTSSQMSPAFSKAPF